MKSRKKQVKRGGFRRVSRLQKTGGMRSQPRARIQLLKMSGSKEVIRGKLDMPAMESRRAVTRREVATRTGRNSRLPQTLT
jgi:hypothetical protein